MLYLLQPRDYGKVRGLFQPLIFQPFCASVLDGGSPGQVFADAPDEPQAAFIITRGMWCYLAGESNNETFNRALNTALFEREIVNDDTFGLLISCHPDNWGEKLVVVCHPRQPILEPRRHYVCHSLSYDWRTNIPEGYTVRLIDKMLTDSVQGEFPDDVQSLLEGDDQTADPLCKGFGFVAIYEDQVAAYAVIDCILGQMGEIGLFTEEAHRTRGLATITSAATIEYGLSHGLSEVIWDCAEHNTGSIRTAEKLDLEYERSHMMHIVVFDEIAHLVSLAWAGLDARRYQEVIDICGRIMARGENTSPSIHYLAACASAGLGTKEDALRHLSTAAQQGWASLDLIESKGEFECLHQTPEWAAVLGQIRNNGSKPETN
jgi:RimJ/RimL family protein N-acetyltransferase